MLKISNLHVKLEEEDKRILKGVDLTLQPRRQNGLKLPLQMRGKLL